MKIQADNLRAIAKAIESHVCDQHLMVFYKKNDWSAKVAKNFTVGEFKSKDGALTVLIDRRLISRLQVMRDKLGRAIVITSGYRTPEHNSSVGGAIDSQHMLGTGADIKVSGFSGDQLAKVAREVGFTGIGIGTDFIHVDVRDTPAEWRY